ncbi:MAG: class I SAM-dependent methyltransferase [Planctomycetota bacterium]
MSLSEHARRQVEMHRHVAHMYRRRSAYPFAEEFQQERNELLMSLAPAEASGRALDLGCGTGVMLDHLADRYGQVFGIDLSLEMLEGFDLSELRPGLRVTLLRGDMAALPLAGDGFDVIVCRSALHHMEDEVAVLREIARVLRPNGRLILGEPANDNLLTRAARAWVRRRPSFGTLHTIDRAYTRGQLRELLAQAGLEVRREERFGFLAYPLCDNPDLVPVLKHLPFAQVLARGLRALDRGLARVPLLRSQSWYTLLEVARRDAPPGSRAGGRRGRTA